MSPPAEQTETLRTHRNAIKIINQAARRYGAAHGRVVTLKCPDATLRAMGDPLLFEQALGIEAFCHCETSGMVGDREVFQTSGTSRRGQFLNRIPAIGRDRVGMKIASQIGEFHESRQTAFLCRCQLAAILS